jgi:hypothetical protein
MPRAMLAAMTSRIAPVVAYACFVAACMDAVAAAWVSDGDAAAVAFRACSALVIAVTLLSGWLLDVRRWSQPLAAIPWIGACTAAWLGATAVRMLAAPTVHPLPHLDGVELLAATLPIAGAAMRRRSPILVLAVLAFGANMPVLAWLVGGVALLQREPTASPIPTARVR